MDVMRICTYLWAVFLVVWVVMATRTKPTETREGVSSRLSYTVLTFAGAYLMFGERLPQNWLRIPLFPPAEWNQALAIVISAAGIAFATWARLYLGSNWSGTVTVKVDHKLVRSGPYRWVRHPIYSGMILGLLGTALARGEVRGLVSVVLVYLGFKIKSKIEERAMTSTFGAQYDEYSRSTGAIVPKLRS
jgi:protein-S-isoprenylcysteine O-methyltransferase Ste14